MSESKDNGAKPTRRHDLNDSHDGLADQNSADVDTGTGHESSADATETEQDLQDQGQ